MIGIHLLVERLASRPKSKSKQLCILTRSSAQHFPNHLAVHIGESEVAALAAEGEAFVIDAKLVEDGGV